MIDSILRRAMITDPHVINRTRLDICDGILVLMGQRELSTEDLAAKAGISDARLCRLLAGEANFKFEELAQIAYALNASFKLVTAPTT